MWFKNGLKAQKLLAQGIAQKAYKKGYEEGKKEGYEEGKRKASKKIALKLLTYNFPIDEIADITDLSIDEIKKLEQYN